MRTDQDISLIVILNLIVLQNRQIVASSIFITKDEKKQEIIPVIVITTRDTSLFMTLASACLSSISV